MKNISNSWHTIPMFLWQYHEWTLLCKYTIYQTTSYSTFEWNHMFDEVSQFAGNATVFSKAYPSWQQRNHQSSALLVLCIRLTTKKPSKLSGTGFCAGNAYGPSIRTQEAAYLISLVPHICVIELGQHWFSQVLVAWSAPSHYLNHCWNIVNWILMNKPQWNLTRNSYIFIQENKLKMSAGKWRPFCPGGISQCGKCIHVTTSSCS